MRRVFAVQDGRGAMLLFDTEEHAEAACAAINADPDYYDTAEVEWRDLYEAGDEMPWLAVPEKEDERREMSDLSKCHYQTVRSGQVVECELPAGHRPPHRWAKPCPKCGKEIMNLPTVKVDDGAVLGERYSDGSFVALERVVIGQHYALVPVEQMEKVWLCTYWRKVYDDVGPCVSELGNPYLHHHECGRVVLVKEDER